MASARVATAGRMAALRSFQMAETGSRSSFNRGERPGEEAVGREIPEGNAHGLIGSGIVATIAAWHLASPGEPVPMLLLLSAGILLTAGVLALTVRKPYLEWRGW